MLRRIKYYALISILTTAHAWGQSDAIADVPLGGEDCDEVSGPELHIAPRAHLRAIWGDTDLEEAELAHGGHDPVKNGLSIPSLSLGADVSYGEKLSAFVEGVFIWDPDEGWEAELEELYVKYNGLPGGIDLKVGRFLAGAGSQNARHPHSWDFVDASLIGTRFLGEEGLVLEGVELTWHLPTRWDDTLQIGFGKSVEHDHEEEEGAGVHLHSEEAEEALWDEDVLALRYTATFWPGDTCKFVYGASYVQGRNFMGHRAKLYGIDFTYGWFEDENHKQQFIWRNEVMYRTVNTDEGEFEEWALSSEMLWRLNPQWQLALRYDYLEGVIDPELAERHRISPSLTRYFTFGEVEAHTRVQYNYDYSTERRKDHSLWLEFAIGWGSENTHVH